MMFTQSVQKLEVMKNGDNLVLAAPIRYKSYLSLFLGVALLSLATLIVYLPGTKSMVVQITGIFLLFLSGALGVSALVWWKKREQLIIGENGVSYGLNDDTEKSVSIPFQEVKEIGMENGLDGGACCLWIKGRDVQIVFGKCLSQYELAEAKAHVVKWQRKAS